MDAVRESMRMMRAEENRLLADRVQVNQVAVRRLQWVLIVLVVAAIALLGWVGSLIAGNARRHTGRATTRFVARRKT